jgi:hypothetical protein
MTVNIVTHLLALIAKNGIPAAAECDLHQIRTAWISDKVEASPDLKVIEVPIQNLDSLLDAGETIGVLKMDVQGHELGVLQGMTRLLKRHAVRDIIFEEEAAFPAPTHKYLKSNGYSIFGLQELFARVRCLPDAQPIFDPADQCQITSLRWTQTARMPC